MYAGVSGGSADARKLAVRLSGERRRKTGGDETRGCGCGVTDYAFVRLIVHVCDMLYD